MKRSEGRLYAWGGGRKYFSNVLIKHMLYVIYYYNIFVYMEPIEHDEYTYIRICFRNKKKMFIWKSSFSLSYLLLSWRVWYEMIEVWSRHTLHYTHFSFKMRHREVGIYKRKRESKKTRKQAFYQESDQERKKTRSSPRK